MTATDAVLEGILKELQALRIKNEQLEAKVRLAGEWW